MQFPSIFGLALFAVATVHPVRAGCETTAAAIRALMQSANLSLHGIAGLDSWRNILSPQADMPPTPLPCPPVAAATTPAAAAEYVKQTAFDNTPYRFNMVQNGKRMTADDFDAWLQANGYSVGRRIAPETTPH